MKVLYVASEVVPYAKSGGLADVAGSLPKELIKLGYDASIIMPRYKMITQNLSYVLDFPVNMNGRLETCIIRKHEQEIEEGKTLTTYFVDNGCHLFGLNSLISFLRNKAHDSLCESSITS